MQSEKALSPVQLVMDQEVASALDRWWRGFQVTDESLALDVIRDVVEGGQEFLAHDHTMRHFRTELLESRLLARTRWELWEADGAKTLAERAADKMQSILAAPPAERLTADQRREIMDIERRALAAIG